MTNLIQEAFQAFENIGSTTSRLAKEAFIREQDNNGVFKELLLYAYNPYKMFYVKKFKIPQPLVKQDEHTNYLAFINLCNQLSIRAITGNAALDHIHIAFSTMEETEQKWYSRVLQKDLKIGITSSTINKVFPNWVPEFSCALAEKYKLKKLPRRYAVEPKLDGYRCLAFRHETHVELRSRNGKPIEGYPRIEEAIMSFPVRVCLRWRNHGSVRSIQ
jgi:hypothetical protein